jgi:hypothetical protein
MKNLNIVKVKFADPKYNYETDVSAETTEHTAFQYFVGKYFNMGAFPVENMQRCIDIEFTDMNKAPDGYEPKKGMLVFIYRSGESDCTNKGITSKKHGGRSERDMIVLVGPNIPRITEVEYNEEYLEIREREVNSTKPAYAGKKFLRAVPMVNGEEYNKGRWEMFGGNFIYTSDSRFSENVSPYPVPVHDRFE